MSAWVNRGSHCLLCTLRPIRSFSGLRTFATTPALYRSKTKKPRDAKEIKPSTKPSAKPSLRPSKSAREKVNTPDFSKIVENVLKDHKRRLEQRSDPGLENWPRFERYVLNACKLEDRATTASASALLQLKHSLKKAYLNANLIGLRNELEYLHYAEDMTAKYSTPNLEQQKNVADMRFPAEWYPQARTIQRTIHLHVGPTNSGKTYRALKQLEACKSGFYAGPLRLLAQEVYHRFLANGTPCSLVTGDDVKLPEGQIPTIVSNTVEMVNLGQPYDVGVIDEIQMIADPKRGWAWTRAVLGCRAKELHLCGEPRIVPMIRELAALTGDKLHIHRYERLNPLKVADKSLQNSLKNLQKGDCLVSFSRVGIHTLKSDIEKATGKRAAIVYGSLPAEIRVQQANLFNDPNNDYDYLVASDAIGMGLNLSCKRIIFETLVKRVPGGLQRLSVPEIKQIAGRAGRYRSAAQQQSQGNEADNDTENIGYVTSLEDIDLPYIRQAMTVEPPPITAAGVFPPEAIFHQFAAYFPENIPLEYIIKRLIAVSQVHPLFFLCDPRSQLENAEVIDTVSGLRFDDQLTFMAAPMHTRDIASRDVTCEFAECVANHTGGRLLDIPGLGLEILEEPVSGSKEYLHDLEMLHKSVILYSWLSFRFGGVFTDRTLASHVKELVEERMIRALTEFSSNKKLRKDASLRRQIALQKQILEHRRLLADADFDTINNEETSPMDLSGDEAPLEGSALEEDSFEGDTEDINTSEVTDRQAQAA
ncbi:ATP-dependent RNA helicase SUV3 [Aspergillus avenaceus]|uniref:RNA helicase n=1 Tax=Aspergillus avenaceus TaxID=36643 RepID=A0A5N6TNN5_ASPAV|nr:ATP-dependent RNA helicase SUV3 [Aspergillus avenaceus]